MEAAHWQILIEHRKEDIALLEDLLAEDALAIAHRELDEKANRWRTTAYFAHPPQVCLPEGFVSVLEPVEQKDWVAETQANFPPLRLGRFLVLGSHHEGMEAAGAITLRLDAGAAFGTGQHATTAGCLNALEWVAKRSSPSPVSGLGEQEAWSAGAEVRRPEQAALYRVLDMGCGSGILGIAAAKLIPAAQVLGVEIDPMATAVAAENVRRNRVGASCRMVTGNGYGSPWVQGEYRLIFANILAGPLVRLAPALACRLEPGGYAVLSGLLNMQANWVLNAHLTQGLALRRRITLGDWTTLIIGK